ncbi:nuclear pore complex protein NUP133 isoform X1 [Cucurbita maxima]|uniref:Nuclear pore complex protein NUP133 isoform X1 n=1 Tax=Cucurbita maxima TaxID=3661 RepID=A0A6J1HYJ4_CUCMA|nr:nuclear pore complex protein NUP133 isoform X1 [Cucurbita maxima]
MFSPGTKRRNSSSRTGRNLAPALSDSPITPISAVRKPVLDNLVPNRPGTGTPAPWTPRLSVLARISPVNKSDKEDETDPVRPVYVGEFPQVVRDEQASLVQQFATSGASVAGGMDAETSLAWIICRDKLFLWTYLLPVATMKCVVRELPKRILDSKDIGRNNNDHWLLSVVSWDSQNQSSRKSVKHQNSVAIIICNKKTGAVVYWPDIFSDGGSTPITCLTSSHEPAAISSKTSIFDGKSTSLANQRPNRPCTFNSLIAVAVPDSQYVCVALACSSNGQLWQYLCSPMGIQCTEVPQDICGFRCQDDGSCQNLVSDGYPRSLTWSRSHLQLDKFNRKFLLLTDHEIQCFCLKLFPDLQVSKLWSYEIVGTDSDLGIKKDLAGQKRIWPLDLQEDEQGAVITILVATFCKDRISSSSYIQYTLLTLQYKSGAGIEASGDKRILEKKAPIQVIIPKARVENEDFLFSMRLRVGGKPSGSALILSGDGTATVSHYYRSSTLLYQFDLPYDAGKVLDASVLPSSEHGEGAWVVLTERAGIWAIPVKAIVLGGVEPPERSLSRRGSSNERSVQDDSRSLNFSGNIASTRGSLEVQDVVDRKKATLSGMAHRTARDEESEALLRQLFHDFLSSGQVNNSFEKLKNSGAFDREDETNVFTRMSKSIVDTLAKHWTTTRGAEIVSMTVVSTQLIDKQQKHEKFLQFLALSKCHEELCSRQRNSLQIILGHGEKLAAMIQLRELQNTIFQNRSNGLSSLSSNSETPMSGALWDLIQFVGERARRNTVLLMDRDNTEVFYSKVSELEEVFNCLERQLDYVVSADESYAVQNQRACEISKACVTIMRAAVQYRNEHQLWYPPSEGLTPWYSQLVVRNGLWHIASLMLQLLNEVSELDTSAKSDLYCYLELLTEVLLESHAGAVTAKAERGEKTEGLLHEFWSRRDSLLSSLYQRIKDSVEAEHKDFRGDLVEQRVESLRKHSSRLLAVAKQHECYSILWSICCDLNDSELLRNLMHESMGPKGGFSYFVFKKLHENKQFSKLLRLGEEFHEELLIFLKEHPDLLWLHELFLHQFFSASDTLHELALSEGDGPESPPEVETEVESDHCNLELKLADRKRLLYLSKIALMAAAAGRNTEYESKLMRIEADAKILKFQEAILDPCLAIETEQKLDCELLHPDRLIQLCLKSKNPTLSLMAFDIFAWTSTSFRETHRKLLEECWKNVADQDDWNQLYEASVAEGWSDEETMRHLRETALFKASSRCYGHGAAEVFGEGGFDAVLTLRQENLEGSIMVKDCVGSVEAILMQHKHFPEAGKLMVTAIMLGVEDYDNRVEDDPILVD